MTDVIEQIRSAIEFGQIVPDETRTVERDALEAAVLEITALRTDRRIFAKLVINMRVAQRRYFRNRKSQDLDEAKDLERRVDTAVEEILSVQRSFLSEVASESHAVARDPRTHEQITQDAQLADEYATPGTVKHFALRLGFMPHDEQDAEAILRRVVRETELK